jgi:hypothetical protein
MEPTDASRNRLAVWSLVLGILSIVGLPAYVCLAAVGPALAGFGCGGCALLALGFVAIALGLAALRQIRSSGGTQTGDGSAGTGIALGSIAALAGLILTILFIVGTIMVILAPSVDILDQIARALGLAT